MIQLTTFSKACKTIPPKVLQKEFQFLFNVFHEMSHDVNKLKNTTTDYFNKITKNSDIRNRNVIVLLEYQLLSPISEKMIQTAWKHGFKIANKSDPKLITT